jgi:transcriptional regulator with XRE-family HTH domain
MAMRKKAGMTQRDLADAVGREQNFIARIETGQRRVDLVEFVIICRACGADAAPETASLVRKIGEMLPRRRKLS